MGKGRRYDQEYKDMIVDLYKLGMSLSEISIGLHHPLLA